ncbi:serine/arginine repetitive matrix protein 2 isoform X5 [Drosophila miranda]|uniref:serine/arginine repetitive matrix protein 2 isoform X5 n=1 Tax=Drosophila miranda TaxID=7229 RepID=UPI00143F42D7|nr:serine/arginine repetitive matrix protein 2 isoform X5 [Drosophila miranda]
MLPFRRGAAWQTLFLLCALAYCINEASSEGRVVCYYTNWSVYRPGTAKFNPQNINPYLCTHLVYAFGGFTKDNQMKPFDKYQDIEQGGYAKFTGLKTYNKQLKTMIAIGGWNEASSRFSPLVASGERRQQFIKNILKFLRQNHFDGIDLDWEYPAHREGGKSRDRDNYAQFVQELRAEFEREAQKTGRTRLLLTMAVPAGIEYIDKGYDVPKLNKYLDWFNVLTYDFHSSHEPSVNHHAPLYSLEEDSEYNYDAELNIDYSIKYYLKAGADRDKLVLGIPTYGRSYTLINEESTELGAPSEGPGEQGDATREKGYLAYYEICQTLKDDPEWTVVQPNANVMGPYAYRRNQWVGYDDEAMVRKKAEYVVAHGLGGIMFWAIDNDDFRGTCNGKPYPLIEAAKEAMVDALGLGINEVAKSNGPQKPSRSRSRDNAVQNRNRLNAKTEAPTPASSRRGPSGGRRTSSTAAPPPPSTTFRLTEADGSSLYIGGRGSTTPAPPTTPDPGSDFKCEEEGFFQHPRDCKKYYWCLDSGPSGLGIVAHQFTCPSGLYFNPAADSCDFARNVPCKSKKSTTASPPVTSTTTTTTVRPNRVTAAPPARPIYAPRTTSSTSTTSTTTTAAPPAEDELEYEEEGSVSDDEPSPGEEDPQVIKELIDLIRKVGGVEQLEKHLLRNKDGSITLKENSASGAPTTPSTISKSLYDRVLSRPGTLNSFTRNRLKINESPASAPETRTESNSSSNSNANYSKYSSVLRGNSRQGPQNEGIEKLTEFDGFLKERKQYVTINRHRSSSQGESEAQSESEEAVEEQSEPETTTRRPISAATPSYTSLRRSRPSTTAASAAESSQEEEEEEQVVQSLSQVKSYATLSRTRGRGTTERPEATTTSSTETESILSSTTNRYKYFERTRPTKSGNVEDAAADPEEDEEEYEEDEPQQNVTNRYQLSRSRATSGSSTTTTTASSISLSTNPVVPPTTTTRRLAFGVRQRSQQVTKLTQVDEEQTEENEQNKDSQESNEEAEDTDTTTAATTATSSRPTPKRIRVLKFRRPINTTDSTATNSATETENHTTNTVNTTSTTATTPTDTTVHTNNTNTNTKRFRKIVRKLRPVETTSSPSVEAGAEEASEDGATRKPFVPSHTRFTGTTDNQDQNQNQNQNDLLNLRQRLKEQQAKGEPLDGVLSTRLKAGLAQKTGGSEDQDVSELQRLRDKVKAEQARGNGDQGVINDRLKKLLAEKSDKSQKSSEKSESNQSNEAPTTEVSARPFFKRKLVARRPYTPAAAGAGAGGTTKAPLSFNSSRPTPKFVRRKNGRFDPFNSSVRNRGEGFVRSDPRGSRLPGADRFKTQKAGGDNEEEEGDDDDEEEEEEEQSGEAVEAQQEQPLNNRPLGAAGGALRRPFVPKARTQLQPQKPQKSQDEESEEEDEEEEEDDEEDEDEEEEAKPQTIEEGSGTPKPKFNNPYRPKDNRALPGSRPSYAPTAGGATGPGGNVPFNPRVRKPNFSGGGSTTANGSGNRFGGATKRPRVVNRPPGVATPNLTLRPVASDYERTTPLTPLKPAPFIPSNTRSYERKYTGPSTEATETASENSLIEDLNIDALNARNKKIFDINSKKHTTLKPKVVKVETETGAVTEVETGTEMETTEQVAQEQEQDQGYVTTTPSTPPPTTQPDTTSNTNTTDTATTETSIEIDTAPPPPPQIPPTITNETQNANEAPSSPPQEAQLSTSTTQSPPPATTLLHVFTLLEGEGEVEEQTASTSTIRPPKAPSHRSSIAEPKHKLIEINRIVEINSKQAKAAQRKSKANQQDFGMLRVESLPHVEQLGEISVVKYVHLVDGSAIQINDGHSTVADYTPTEPTAYRSPSAPVRNTLPLNEADTETEADRSGKSLLPEVISGALETSTISLEGLFDSPRKGKQLSSNSILQDDTEEPTTIESESETTVVPPTFAAVQATYLRQPTTANVSRRPVLSVRRRIINTPTSAAAAAAAATAATTTQIAELTTTSKYNRLRSRPAVAAATTIPAAAATATAATTPPAAAVGATSAAVAAAASANRGSSNSNGYLSKLKAKSSSSAETTAAIVSGSSSSSSASSNDITQKQHKFQPASFALRRQFQTRRLTTFAPGASSGDESDVFLYTAATEVPRTQNPLFKRRLTLISTTPPPATRTTIVPALTETTTNLYANEDDEDQVAKSSIHTSRFNQIPFESVASSGSTTTSSSTTSTTAATPLALGPGIRRQLVPRPRRPQSTTVATPYYSTGNPGAGHSAPPLSRRQQSRRRPHKYIEVYSRPPSKPALVTATASSRRNDYPAALDYEEGGQRRRSSKSQSALQSQSQSEPKVIVHGRGIIECRAQGNFPHPLNCRKFISCARFEETGGIVGWEYTCPKGLTYDSNDGMCTWSPSDHVACRD